MKWFFSSIKTGLRRILPPKLHELQLKWARMIPFSCISPAMAAKVYGVAGVKGVKLTIGNDKGTSDAVKAMGAEHVDCGVRDCVVDSDHKVVSTPAYMLAQGISEAAEGIDKAVAKVLEMAK